MFDEDFNYLYIVPHNKGITTAPFWQAAVDWIWDTFFYSFKAFNEVLIVKMLVPMKEAYLGMPVAATFLLVMGTAYILAGSHDPRSSSAGFYCSSPSRSTGTEP